MRRHSNDRLWRMTSEEREALRKSLGILWKISFSRRDGMNVAISSASPLRHIQRRNGRGRTGSCHRRCCCGSRCGYGQAVDNLPDSYRIIRNGLVPSSAILRGLAASSTLISYIKDQSLTHRSVIARPSHNYKRRQITNRKCESWQNKQACGLITSRQL